MTHNSLYTQVNFFLLTFVIFIVISHDLDTNHRPVHQKTRNFYVVLYKFYIIKV